MAFTLLASCAQPGEKNESEMNDSIATDDFVWMTEQFADIKIVRYQVPGFDNLSLSQKKLAYYLTEAGYSGRDIIWDQNYRHNLKIRTALEGIVKTYSVTNSLILMACYLAKVSTVKYSLIASRPLPARVTAMRCRLLRSRPMWASTRPFGVGGAPSTKAR